MGDGSNLLNDLTDAQRAAVAHREGPMLVLAGPGSGKTTVVTRRIASLVSEGIAAHRILALTFTNKAAGEMRQRVESLLQEGGLAHRGLTIATFHAFCASLLRRHPDEAGVPRSFTIYDATDQRQAFRRAIEDAGLSIRNWAPASVAAAVSRAKNSLVGADAFETEARDFYARTIARIYRSYEAVLRAAAALDFDDLLLACARLLADREDVRGELQERWTWMLIDEYQDTNHAQFVIADQLASRRRNLFVVGDPDQSIYAWRGADIRNILDFQAHYPEATVLPLGRNFRSTGHIVEAAAGLIAHNVQRIDRPLHTDLGDGQPVRVVTCLDERHEARCIVEAFQWLRDDHGLAWKDCAVLCRINAQTRVLEESFRAAQIPCVIARGTAFYERKEVRDALACIRLLVNPADELALRRIVNVPPRGIGRTTLDRLAAEALRRGTTLAEVIHDLGVVPGLSPRAVAAVGRFTTLLEGWRDDASGEGSTPAGLVERIIRDSGLEAHHGSGPTEEALQRVENLAELVSAAAEFVPPSPEPGTPAPTTREVLAAWLESVALVSDVDAIDPLSGAVTLMTLHAAKGLEYEAIAVSGLEEGLLPHARSLEDDAALEEERRLCFVGLTRARRHLLLTRATMRSHRGVPEHAVASRFLAELPEGPLVREDVEGAEVTVSDGVFPDDGSEAFTVGRLVRHPTFGVGRIERILRRPRGSSATVRFALSGTRTLVLEYAGLQPVDEADPDTWGTT